MSTQTRTPEQIYGEIEALTVQSLGADVTNEEYAERSRQRAKLWAELRRALPVGTPTWALAAVCHVVVDVEERAERAARR